MNAALQSIVTRRRAGPRHVLGTALLCLLPLASAHAGHGGPGDADDDFVFRSTSVAQRLGGVDGLTGFIVTRVTPALLASDLGPIFRGELTRLSETSAQLAGCFARLLDHDLGGSAPKNGAIVVDAAAPPDFPAEHKCRSSMSNVHRGMRISDAQFDLFVSIVAREALNAGVTPADVEAVGKVLERYRGSITDK